MKRLAFLSVLAFGLANLQAGGFGGPPPFSNGSPLTTGIDGSYQASARGKNLSGVFRFSYASQTQTPFEAPVVSGGLIDASQNDYIFFVNGVAYRGLTQASITQSSVSGVFDNGAANVVNFEMGDGLGLLSFMSGFFSGKMALDASDSFFEGKGTVVVLNQETIPGQSTTTQDPGTGEFDIPLNTFFAAVNELSVRLGITPAEAADLIGFPTWIPPTFSTTTTADETVYAPNATVDFKFTGVRLNTGSTATTSTSTN